MQVGSPWRPLTLMPAFSNVALTRANSAETPPVQRHIGSLRCLHEPLLRLRLQRVPRLGCRTSRALPGAFMIDVHTEEIDVKLASTARDL